MIASVEVEKLVGLEEDVGGGGEAVPLGVGRQERPLLGRGGAEEDVADERVDACRGISPCRAQANGLFMTAPGVLMLASTRFPAPGSNGWPWRASSRGL